METMQKRRSETVSKTLPNGLCVFVFRATNPSNISDKPATRYTHKKEMPYGKNNIPTDKTIRRTVNTLAGCFTLQKTPLW